MDFTTLIERCCHGAFLPLCEQFYSLQAEGYYTGNAAYFIRLSGCDVGCSWCDSKESWSIANPKMVAIEDLVNNVLSFSAPRVVITGGEPAIYPLGKLVCLLHDHGILVNIETSGTREFCGGIDWITLSPKENKPALDCNFERADELKVVVCDSSDLRRAEEYAKKVSQNCKIYLQPQWNEPFSVKLIIEYIKKNPKWVLSLQTHKYINIQ